MATVTFSTSQFGVEYSVWQADSMIASFDGNGGAIQFELEPGLLSTGTNTIKISATHKTCSAQELVFEISLEILTKPQIVYDATANLLVNGTGQPGHWFNNEITINEVPAINKTGIETKTNILPHS